MNPRMPAARWQPANLSLRRPIMGQAPQPVLNVTVRKDGSPLSGVDVEVLFQDGSSKTGKTGGDGVLSVPYTSAQIGQTVVRLTPPEGVEDLGEGAAQGVNLQGGAPAEVAFELVSAPAVGSPIVGVLVAGALYGLALA